MKKELEILQFIEAYLKQNQNVVLMVVVESQGSSPGRQGFKMAVAADAICGSIGGGVMEINLVETAKEFLALSDDGALEKFGHSVVFTMYQDHRKNRPHASGMICNGKQRVLFFKIKPTDIKNLKSIKNSLTKYKQGILLISKSEINFVTPEMNQFNNFIDSKDDFYFIEKENAFGYREKLGFKKNLYIIGGGHCALALSELMSKLDFYITVFDDRPELNTLEKNKFVDRIEIIESYEQITEFIDSDSNAFVVVMTLGYKFDEIVIRQLINKNFKYFGVLGSKAKMKTLLKNLEKEGISKEKLARLHTPIGLPINSRTPGEIAVSIAAEIISIKNNSKSK